MKRDLSWENIMAIFKSSHFLTSSALIAVGFISAFTYAPLANAFGVGVQPSTVEMTIKPGDRQRQVICLLYTSPSPRDRQKSRMPSSA